MKIAIICGCLEEGKNGVGDYTRKLASAIGKEYYLECTLIAINDMYVDKIIEYEYEGLKFLRLPKRYTDNEKFNFIKCNLDRFDWCSLQYVPFSYHDKGLPFKLAHQLKNSIRAKKWHITFHELWVGIPDMKNWKEYIIGSLQKKIINRMLGQLKPSLVSTSIPIYFKKLDYPNKNLLPLFGNIELVKNFKSEYNADKFLIVHFGTFTLFLDQLKQQLIWCILLARKFKKNPVLYIMGNSGSNLDKVLNTVRELLPETNIKILGLLDEDEISELFYKADIGISRANLDFYGKSGSTISMLEHGLPVILRGKSPKNKKSETDGDNVYFADEFLPDDICRHEPKSKLWDTAEKFYNTLLNY